MGTPVLRSTDKTALGGAVISVRNVFAQGMPVAAMGDAVTPHPHGNTPMSGTVQTMGKSVFVGGIALARQGDMATPPCAEPIIPSATTVFSA